VRGAYAISTLLNRAAWPPATTNSIECGLRPDMLLSSSPRRHTDSSNRWRRGAILGSVVFSALVGVFFGYYPALKSFQLNPIDALRFE
jgi:hypothetical protein